MIHHHITSGVICRRIRHVVLIWLHLLILPKPVKLNIAIREVKIILPPSKVTAAELFWMVYLQILICIVQPAGPSTDYSQEYSSCFVKPNPMWVHRDGKIWPRQRSNNHNNTTPGWAWPRALTEAQRALRNVWGQQRAIWSVPLHEDPLLVEIS